MNKTTEALKLAQETLLNAVSPKRGMYYTLDEVPTDCAYKYQQALAAIREVLAEHIPDATKMVGCAYCDNPLFAGTKCNNCGRVTLAEPVKQEPVAYVYEKDVAGIGMRKDVAFTKHVEVGTDLYAAPVDAKSIREALANARAEALEEAAKVCDNMDNESSWKRNNVNCAAAIRGLTKSNTGE